MILKVLFPQGEICRGKEGRKNILQLQVLRGTLVLLAIIVWSSCRYSLVKIDPRTCIKFIADSCFLFLDSEVGSRETEESLSSLLLWLGQTRGSAHLQTSYFAPA